jgi:DNA polymerase I
MEVISLTSNLAIDIECTKAPRHFPWIEGASLTCVSVARDDGETKTWFFNHPDREKYHPDKTFRESLGEIQYEITNSSRLIAHNLKFDFHWLRAMGIDCSTNRLYCTMLGEYIINNQSKQQGISLAELSLKYGLPAKKDKVKIYWDAGAETDEIPSHILQTYCEQDTLNALAIYHAQVPRILGNNLHKLVSLEMETLRCLADMEYNGMAVDKDRLQMYNTKYGEELREIDAMLSEELQIENVNSGDQLSVALFGFGDREGLFDAKKFAIEPLKKDGYFSTALPELLKLKARNQQQRKILDMLRQRSRLSQLKSTYFTGLQTHVRDGIIHQSLNQCLTVTGRTSCSKPNAQNIPRGNTGPVKECFVTRWR